MENLTKYGRNNSSRLPLVCNASEYYSDTSLFPYILHSVNSVWFGMLSVSVMFFNSMIIMYMPRPYFRKGYANAGVVCTLLGNIYTGCFSIPMAFVFVRKCYWVSNSTVCFFSAYCDIIGNTWISCTMFSMCLERCFATCVHYPSKTAHGSYKKALVFVFSNILILSTAFPVLVSSQHSTASVYTHRFACTVATTLRNNYIHLYRVSYDAVVIAGTALLLLVVLVNCKHFRDVYQKRHEKTQTELFFEESYFWNELQTLKFVVASFCTYVVLLYPSAHRAAHGYLRKNTSGITVWTIDNQSSFDMFMDISTTYNRFLFAVIFPIICYMFREDLSRKVHYAVFSLRGRYIRSLKNLARRWRRKKDNFRDIPASETWGRRRLSSVSKISEPIVFGSGRRNSSPLQLMDIETGISRWKATLQETLSPTQRKETLFSNNLFEEEEEASEAGGLEDATEDEINSGEDILYSAIAFSDIIVHASHEGRSTNPTLNTTSFREIKEDDKRVPRPKSMSQSFHCKSRPSAKSSTEKRYRTLPKSFLKDKSLESGHRGSTCDLLKALQSLKMRNSETSHTIIPSGTAELLDTSNDSRCIVSL